MSVDPVHATAPARLEPTATKLLVPLAVGAAVSVALGVYGRAHEPTGVGVLIAGFSGAQAAKAWMATGVVLLALVQIGSALVMYGKVSKSWFAAKTPYWTK